MPKTEIRPNRGAALGRIEPDIFGALPPWPLWRYLLAWAAWIALFICAVPTLVFIGLSM